MFFNNHITKIFTFFLIYFFNFSNCISFSIEEVAKGIFVHFGEQQDANEINKGDIANIGFIVGKKSIMVIDTGGTQLIGKSLLNKIKETSKLPISHVVLTHAHPDHFFGTEEFVKENPKIVGHEKLNRSLVNNFEFYKNSTYSQTQLELIKKAKLVKADVLVKTNEIIEIDLGQRIIEIRAWQSGHTDNDLSIYDQNSKTFWSENIFVERIPSIRASILGWKKNLEETMNMDIKLIVPGHGQVLSKEKAIKPILAYFDRIIKQIRGFHKENKSLQESINYILQDEILDPSQVNKENWVLFTNYHYSNITKAFTELEWE